MYYELRRDVNRKFRWRLISNNGRTVAESGEGYSRRCDCIRAVDAVRFSADATIVDTTKKSLRRVQ